MRYLIARSVRRHYLPIKRIIDVVVASALLLLLAPVLVIAIIAIKLTSKGPAIFWSSRTGRNGELFNMPKLRSMTVCSKVVSRETSNAQDINITKVGSFLRLTSLDEIPQLWCVITGKMSIIGPRPILHNDYAIDERNSRPVIYSVRPGITGLAQVKGRNLVKPRDKSRYDAFYAQSVCANLDFKIALKTVLVILNPKLVM